LERYGDHGPNMNFLYATKDNHIGYSSIGTIPLRRNPNSGIYVKDGSTSEHDWIGKIDREKKLSLHDP
jgi:acyl-homoserine lactone acylase PvdQ